MIIEILKNNFLNQAGACHPQAGVGFLKLFLCGHLYVGVRVCVYP